MILLHLYNDFYSLPLKPEHSVLYIYILEVVVDLVLGNLLAYAKGTHSSKVGIKGGALHGGILLMVMLLSPLIDCIGMFTVFSQGILLVTFVPSYATSILANLKIAGFPVNDKVVKAITAEIERKEEKY
ncbi:holin [Lactococcus phage WP-2]|uniref:Holin n=1 Tax=Lactococcus phage WP-2 TaxID=1486423 RepID=A0A024B3T7_9CAUD|nr:holin [Lactococcus phage WP-2]AHZ10891.1 holin [Lactococcus phage WP-2]